MCRALRAHRTKVSVVCEATGGLDYLLKVQQRPDGSFPQNTKVDGTPVFGSLQLDEVADPILLAYQLGRKDATTWSQHVKPAADFLVNYVTPDGHPAPDSLQERWEEQSGYSPSSIASEIAGLVCAADIAQANGDAMACSGIATPTTGTAKRPRVPRGS